MKPVRFHDEAKAEITHETLYCNAVSKALAERFLAAVQDAVALASEFPAMGAQYKYGTRRCFPKKFPFGVVYVERPHEVSSGHSCRALTCEVSAILAAPAETQTFRPAPPACR